ncbi:hypothetical protein D9757_008936 [Collybiopsis confluens]|uniref:ornithine decarboxylase n=1 Tax=Collybiopsis confluens TaxID=2823264 RepID=A0A8H5HEV8_9AGAR|nr:hypothetical protein D9757_008936 [Collybiopsis confluens]
MKDTSMKSLPPLFRGGSRLLLEKEVAKRSQSDVQGHDSFFVADLSKILQQHLRWMQYLPFRPFYAVKCNPDPYVIRLLAALGAGFDCASISEIKDVLEVLGDHPGSGSHILFANPCKFSADVRYSAEHDVRMATFDNADELEKMARFHPRCQLLLRLLTDDTGSPFPLGHKYGASLAIVPALLEKARGLQLNVVGVSFHVGSSCYKPDVFRDAIWRSKEAFAIAQGIGYQFTILDIGGGFDDSPVRGSETSIFEQVAGVVRQAIDDYFPVPNRPPGFEVIAEPGRFHVFPSFTYATNIIARRLPSESGYAQQYSSNGEASGTAPLMYYISDGIYGGLANIVADHRSVHPYVVSLGGKFNLTFNRSELEPSSLWGPTCDSVDLVSPRTLLPRGLQIGDWIAFPDMGAYTTCLATKFNGCEAGPVVHATGDGEHGEEVYFALMRFKKDRASDALSKAGVLLAKL